MRGGEREPGRLRALLGAVSIGLVLAASAAALGAVLWSYLAPAGEPAPDAAAVSAPGEALALADVLGGAPPEGWYRQALEPVPFSFPRDHGPHPGFRSEWWYFTGNLAAPGGRRFGYQLTVFRFEVARGPLGADGTVRDARPQIYLGHFALTDVATGRFHPFERLGRAATGTAGARARPFRVWLDGWEMAAEDGGGEGLRAVRLRARDGEVGIELSLRALTPVIPQGRAGLSRKGARAGDASYYYSVPRWDTTGEVRIGGRRWRVEGTSWLDREWSTSALGPEQVGWDWFGLQLDDGTDLMFYALRTAQGGRDPASAGSLVEPDGTRIPLGADDVRITVEAAWTGPAGRRYPGRWRLAVRPPGGPGLELEVVPLVRDQLWRGRIEYWEGAVRVEGHKAGSRVGGWGYAELTGYAGSAPSARARLPGPGISDTLSSHPEVRPSSLAGCARRPRSLLRSLGHQWRDSYSLPAGWCRLSARVSPPPRSARSSRRAVSPSPS